ncbi:response regulator transcription factor [Falsiroseomonas sp. HC035]|uniref:response regulator transcription factor n=1 Tax=Falsiroseomonas sp. HC035 TaxID=3390999 RepID=UPI003D32372E
MHSLLIVEDDAILAGELLETFADHGMAARSVDKWPAALKMLEDWQPDLIILDQRLGAVDTLLMLPALRALTAAPVLFLTGNRSEADRVIGLELGADDFLLKPIAGRELVARVRAHLRRTVRREAVPAGEWRIAPSERRLYRPDRSAVPLTAAEFTLLALLAERPGTPVDREVLTQQVLRRPYRAEDRSLDNLVHQIRRKLGCRGAGEVIVAIRNQGYAFNGFPEA